MLGLSDADPYKIVLAKGIISGGITADTADTKVLYSGSTEYNMSDGLWHHLSLEVIVQPNGDVLLKCKESNLSLYDINNPTWTNVSGFPTDGYIDDVLSINSGSIPLYGGYAGFGFAVNNALNRRAAFDALQVSRAD